MTERLEILNSESHRELRMRSDAAIPPPHFVPIVISEFSAAASSCPIFFAKDKATGEFYAAALFGFRPGELLVEGAEQGDSAFRPLDLQRQGFYTSGENIALDINHLRFGDGATIALFDDDGAPSSALRRIQHLLGQLNAGFDATRAFIGNLLSLKLIEPIDISLRFDDGEQLSLDGLYTISRDRLSDLADGEVVALFRSGHLQAALAMAVSLNQIAVLAARRNRRLVQ